jgi:hypothetical protein
MSKEPIKTRPKEVSKDTKMPTYHYQTYQPGSLKAGLEKKTTNAPHQAKHLLQNLGGNR